MNETFEQYRINGKKNFFNGIYKGTKIKTISPIIDLEKGPIRINKNNNETEIIMEE